MSPPSEGEVHEAAVPYVRKCGHHQSSTAAPPTAHWAVGAHGRRVVLLSPVGGCLRSFAQLDEKTA